MTLKKEMAPSAATEERHSKVLPMTVVIALIKRERKERVFRTRSRLLLRFSEFSILNPLRFDLPGLAAPLGILGADAGASYGWQEPRVSSRLLSLQPLRYGRCQIGASHPFHTYVTLRNGSAPLRNVSYRRHFSCEATTSRHPTFPKLRSDPLRQWPFGDVSLGFVSLAKEMQHSGSKSVAFDQAGFSRAYRRGAQLGAYRLPAELRPYRNSLSPGLLGSPSPTPPLKPKAARREAPHSARASERRSLASGNREAQRGVFVTPPSRITPA